MEKAKKYTKFSLTLTLREMPVGTYVEIGANQISKYGIKKARHRLYQDGMIFKLQTLGRKGYIITKVAEGIKT